MLRSLLLAHHHGIFLFFGGEERIVAQITFCPSCLYAQQAGAKIQAQSPHALFTLVTQPHSGTYTMLTKTSPVKHW